MDGRKTYTQENVLRERDVVRHSANAHRPIVLDTYWRPTKMRNGISLVRLCAGLLNNG